MPNNKTPNKWISVGLTMLIGLFVAYLDRSNLTIALTEMGIDLGFAGNVFISSSLLTAFSIGYAISNIFGGILTQRKEPKAIVVITVAVWSIGTIATGFISSVMLLYAFRILLGVCEGFYWPQMSRIVLAWFSPEERTRANSVVQYYGQFLALALGFFILTPIHDAFGWRILFIITGGLGILLVVPLYLKNLRKVSDSPYGVRAVSTSETKLTLGSFGGPSFFLLVFAYLTQGMLFWGITLWISPVVTALGFTGYANGFMSGIPYLAAVLFAIPMTAISDKTGKRTIIATLGMVVAGVLLMFIGFFQNNNVAVIILITLAMGYYASSFTPNIWTIIQAYIAPEAVGVASGIVNGIGAGLGGTLAGYLVGLMNGITGSYSSGFVMLGSLVLVGGVCLYAYGRINSAKKVASQVDL